MQNYTTGICWTIIWAEKKNVFDLGFLTNPNILVPTLKFWKQLVTKKKSNLCDVKFQNKKCSKQTLSTT